MNRKPVWAAPHCTAFALTLGLLLTLFPALSGCAGGSSTEGENVNPPAGVGTYTVVGNTIVTPAHEETTYTCLGSESQMKITKFAADSAVFEVSAETLQVESGIDTARSGAIVRRTSVFARIGIGSGLEGHWKLTEQAYQAISGSLTTVEASDYESNRANSRHLLSAFVNSSVEIGGGRITTVIEAKTAELFMESWNGSNPFVFHKADSAKFDMTARAVDAHTLELKGRKTGETVRLVMTSAGGDFTGDIVYTSDKAGNASYHYNAGAKTCPNPAQPDWYLAFQNANLKPGTKGKTAAGEAMPPIASSSVTRFPATL